MVILDADLEYDPQDIPSCSSRCSTGEATVVYGNRMFGSHTAYSFWYVMGNKGVTTVREYLLQLLHRRPGDLLQADAAGAVPSLDIRSHGFGMEAEITGKLLRRQIRPYEVPITTGPAAAKKARRSPGRTGSRRSGSSAASGSADRLASSNTAASPAPAHGRCSGPHPHGSKSTLPRWALSSSHRCASAASDIGNRRSITGRIAPDSISGQTC